MKKLLLAVLPMLFLCGCSEPHTVIFVSLDGTETEYVFNGEKFQIEVPEEEGYYYLGGFAKEDVNSTKYISYKGQSIDFSVEDYYPTKIYQLYMEKQDSYTIELAHEDVVITSSGTKTATFAIGEALSYYLGEEGLSAYVRLEFEHYEKEEGVIGINTFDWSTYQVKYGSEQLDSGALRANDAYTKFDQIYKVDEFSEESKFAIEITRPSNCVSTASATYRNFKVTYFIGDEKFLTPHKYDNINTGASALNLTVQNGSATLNSSYCTTASIDFTLPWNIKEYLLEKNKEEGTVELTINSYGKKGGVFGLISNWSTYKASISANGYTLASITDGHLESNSSFSDAKRVFTVTEGFKGLDKVHIDLAYGTPGGSPNASGMFYYIHYIKIGISV